MANSSWLTNHEQEKNQLNDDDFNLSSSIFHFLQASRSFYRAWNQQFHNPWPEQKNLPEIISHEIFACTENAVSIESKKFKFGLIDLFTLNS